MKMIALFKNKTMNIVMAAAILITCVLSGSITTYADELPEPYPHPSSYLQDVHVGQYHIPAVTPISYRSQKMES